MPTVRSAREHKLPNGEIWRNVVTEEKSKVAETLADFRGNYKYNLLDANLRAFNAEVPIFAQWDDHEVTDDWMPGGMPLRRRLSREELRARGARQPRLPRVHADAADAGRARPHLSQDRLRPAARRVHARHALLSRANGDGEQESYGPDAHLLGPTQLAWLKRELARSRATWKVIAADLPIGLFSHDAIAQGDGPPLGRELEIAELLRS